MFWNGFWHCHSGVFERWPPYTYQRSAIPGIGIEVLTLGPVLVLVLGIDLGLLAVLVLVLGIVLSLLEVLILGIDHGLLRVLILLLSFVKNFHIYQG